MLGVFSTARHGPISLFRASQAYVLVAVLAVMDPAALPANSPVSEMPSNPPDQSLAMVLADPGQPGSGMADPMQQASGQMDPHQAMVAASMAG